MSFIDDRIPTHLWVDSKIRECMTSNIPVYVVRRGNKTGGLIIVKVSNLEGFCRVFVQQRDVDGQLGWHPALGDQASEQDADAFIDSEIKFDEDLWVLEVEDREMKNPFADSKP